MVCFYHQTIQAVGVCKNCHKGLCADCAVDVGNGLACKNHCENEVALINNVFERSKIQYQRLGSIYGRTALWMGGIGSAMILIGILAIVFFPRLWIPNSLLLIMGVFFLVSAALNRAESQKHSKPQRDMKDE